MLDYTGIKSKEAILRISQFDLPRRDLSKEAQQDLLELRTSGLSLLASRATPLTPHSQEDEEWIIQDSKKDTHWGYPLWNKLLKRAAWSGDFESADEVMKSNSTKETNHLQEYIDANWDELDSHYNIYTTQWFKNWNSFWMENYNAPASQLDLDIFFSLVNPKPPDWPKVTFFKVNSKLNSQQRALLTPKLIRHIWNTPTLRSAVLKGKPLPPEWEVIAPYSTIWSRITTLNQNYTLNEIYKRKSRGETIKVKLPGGKIITY